MKNIFRKLSSILALMLTVTSTTISAYTAPINSDNKIDLLKKMDIISEVNDNDDFSKNRAVTRSEFCLYIARVLKLDLEADIDQMPFSDIDSNESLVEYIYPLYKIGIVSGYGGNFRPMDKITYNEAIKMIISASGYENVAKTSGGYPSGYLKVASELSITKDVKIQDYSSITKGECAELIFNMLNAPVLEIKSFGSSGLTFSKNENTNLFELLYDIYYSKGKVTSTHDSSLVNKVAPLDMVTINGEDYLIGETKVADMLGSEIEFFYRYDKIKDQKTILQVVQQYNSENKIIIEDIDIISFKNGIYKYRDKNNKREKTLKLSADFSILYNGEYPSNGFTPNMMIPTNGRITAIQNQQEDYDVLIIENYESCIVESVDKGSKQIYCKDGTVKNFGLLEKILLDGSEMDFSDIKKNDVISALWNADRTSVTLYVSRNKINGQVSLVDEENSKKIIGIDGEKYIALNNCYNLSKIKAGATTNFYLDINDRIVGAEECLTEGFHYGYLLRMYVNRREDDKISLKFLDQDGEIKKIDLVKKVRINEQKYSSYEETKSIIENMPDDLFKFSLNKDGDINEMYICDTSTDRYLHKIQRSGVRLYWNLKQRTFGGQTAVEQNSPIFFIPNTYDEDDFKVKNLSYLTNDRTYDFSIYTIGDNAYGEVLVQNASATPTYDRKTAVVKKAITCLDEFDEIQIELSVLYNGTEKKYITKRKEIADGISKGDIIRFELIDDVIHNILKIYDGNSKSLLVANPYEPQTGAGYRSENRIYFGYVYLNKDGLMKYSKNEPSESSYKTDPLKVHYSLHSQYM